MLEVLVMPGNTKLWLSKIRNNETGRSESTAEEKGGIMILQNNFCKYKCI
jgi:hypothetical protein